MWKVVVTVVIAVKAVDTADIVLVIVDIWGVGANLASLVGHQQNSWCSGASDHRVYEDLGLPEISTVPRSKDIQMAAPWLGEAVESGTATAA